MPRLPFSLAPIREKKTEEKRKKTGYEPPAFPQDRITGADV
jgi:hypothetical protein